jgi:hypothetical protein
MNTPETEAKSIPGAPIDEFKAVLDDFVTLQHESKFSLFQGRNNSIRVIGDVDELVNTVRKRPGCDKIDPGQVRSVVEEIRRFVQIFLLTGDEDRTVSLLVNNVYDDEIEGFEDQDAARKDFSRHLRGKLDLVRDAIITPPMHERGKRISSCISPILEDLDIEIVQRRLSPLVEGVIASPFLRLKFRYSEKSNSWNFLPPWVPSFSEGRAFELECDETDIDLLIARLLKAKELLSTMLDSDISKPKTATDE